MKSIPDPDQRAQVQSLFKVCKNHVKDAQIALETFRDVDSVDNRYKGLRAMLKQLRYV